MRIGQGFDTHRFEEGGPLVLGGVEIDHPAHLAGHSDGDALFHAVADALLGALGAGDLGAHFPSSDPALAGINSREILERVAERMRSSHFEIGNLDATIIAEVPRLAPHQSAMRGRLAAALGVEEARVNLKITSSDGLGALGRGEGIGALAVVLLVSADDAPGAAEA